MIMCQIRLVGDDILLEARKMDAVPSIGEEIVIGGVAYQTVTPASDVISDAAVIYVKKVSGA